MCCERCTDALTCTVQREVQYITNMQRGSNRFGELDELVSLMWWMSMLRVGKASCLKPY